MEIQENKTAGQLMRERYFKIKNSRKLSLEIIQVLENHKEEYLKKHRELKIVKNQRRPKPAE